MGLLFLVVWVSNLAKGLYGADYVPFVQGWIARGSVHVYVDFLRNVVVPHAAAFRTFQLVAELAIALLLLAGLLTPLTSIIAAGFTLNLLVASRGTPNDWWGTYVLMLAILAAVAVSQAGRTWGVDAFLARRNPHPFLPLY
jgi:uncharacterized membrane protein YphA (DoxX/SURF4 family)